MNYRHHFHAANFADVLKHGVLCAVLEKLQQKTTPLTYLETHAGRGLYHLHSRDTQRLQEYCFGIEALSNYAATHPAPASLQCYLNRVQTFFSTTPHKIIYPGSPKIAEFFMRPTDKMILCELHPEELHYLKQNMWREDRLIHIHAINGYDGTKAYLPPKTARGLVLIDPSFEDAQEFSHIAEALCAGLRRWRLGKFLIWYPIKDKKRIEKFHKKIKDAAQDVLLINFFMNSSKISSNLMGCGMALINPPWNLSQELAQTLLPYLAQALHGRWTLESNSSRVVG